MLLGWDKRRLRGASGAGWRLLTEQPSYVLSLLFQLDSKLIAPLEGTETDVLNRPPLLLARPLPRRPRIPSNRPSVAGDGHSARKAVGMVRVFRRTGEDGGGKHPAGEGESAQLCEGPAFGGVCFDFELQSSVVD